MLNQEYEKDVHNEIQKEQEELAYAPPSTISPSPSPVQPSTLLFEEEISTPKDNQTAESSGDTGKLQKP